MRVQVSSNCCLVKTLDEMSLETSFDTDFPTWPENVVFKLEHSDLMGRPSASSGRLPNSASRSPINSFWSVDFPGNSLALESGLWAIRNQALTSRKVSYGLVDGKLIHSLLEFLGYQR